MRISNTDKFFSKTIWGSLLISSTLFLWSSPAFSDKPNLSLTRSPASVALPQSAPADPKPTLLKQKLVNSFTPEGVAPALKRSSREGE
jgi:hypothetical protein